MLLRWKGALAATAMLAFTVGAHAQTPQDVLRAIEQNNRIQQENNERLRREQQERLNQPQAVPEINVPEVPAVPIAEPKGNEPCQDVKEIVLQGANNLDVDEQKKLTAPFTGRCISLGDINSLLAVITNAYVAKGLVTARAYIAPQDMSSGKLEILVVEGRVDKLLLEDGKKNNSINLATAFPGVKGKPLSLPDLEQGLDQVNRLAANNATMDIQPGNGIGSSTVLIKNEPRKSWSAGASVDNYGSKSTGINQLGVNASLYNLSRLNDLINLSQNRSFPYSKTGIGQVANSASYSIPYGYYTFTLSWSGSEYDSQVTGTAGAFETTGTTGQTTLKADRVIYRGKAGRAALSMDITTKKTRNYILGELISASSRNLSIFNFGGNFVSSLWGGGLTLELAYSQGLKILDAEEDRSDLPDFAPRAQFQRINYGFTWNKPLSLLDQSLTFSSQLQGQYGLDALYSSEQISVGSFYSVRGFRETSVAGDRGLYVRNDLSLNLPLDMRGRPFLRPYLGLDAGSVNERYVSTGGTLAGMALGASLSLGGANFDVSATRSLHVPNDLPREKGYLFLRASYSL
ncbi:MAG: ShlB/FhaC/HecB family hemolysin secretion/activation protein [Pedobacter sp.]|nr:ShlB/FhaC/HecB family hemolysin secretion/activation protein [Pedobacter sp.]